MLKFCQDVNKKKLWRRNKCDIYLNWTRKSKMTVRSNRRAKLPLYIRRVIQRIIQNLSFLAISWITLFNMYTVYTHYRNFGDITRFYGFNPGRLLWYAGEMSSDNLSERGKWNENCGLANWSHKLGEEEKTETSKDEKRKTTKWCWEKNTQNIKWNNPSIQFIHTEEKSLSLFLIPFDTFLYKYIIRKEETPFSHTHSVSVLL